MKKLLSMLRGAVTGTRTIATGRAAGYVLAAPRRADPRFALGTYETPVQDAIAGILKPGDVFYDIGANIGFFALVAARSVGSAGRVYAFEPVPDNAAAIGRSVRLNDLAWVEVITDAVGGRTGPGELWLARHIGGAALEPGEAPKDRRGKMTVDVVTLEHAIRRRRLRPPDLIKIDVEGAELEVLQGMPEILQNVRPALLYEVDSATTEGLYRKSCAMAEFLRSFNYGLRLLPSAYPGLNWHVAHVVAMPECPSSGDP